MINKKYTMKEFEEMYDKAVIKTEEKMTKDFKNTVDKTDKDIPPLAEFGFTLQNMLAMQKLKIELFRKGEK